MQFSNKCFDNDNPANEIKKLLLVRLAPELVENF